MTIAASTSSNGPIGTVLGPGSTGLTMNGRESQVAELIGLGWSLKKIGHELGITAGGVGAHVSNIAARIPGEGSAKLKVAAWVWSYGDVVGEDV